MAWSIMWAVKCERCDAVGPKKPKAKLAEAAATKLGWLLGMCGGMHCHLCESCGAKGLPDGWPRVGSFAALREEAMCDKLSS